MTTKRQQYILTAIEQYDRSMQNHYRQHLSMLMEAERVYRESRLSADTGLEIKTTREKEALLKALREAQDTVEDITP